ncbi:TPR repeat-containing protein [Frankia sp. CcI6]|nr:TPR repeat-containing protein [Frankia sp. CcI6]
MSYRDGLCARVGVDTVGVTGGGVVDDDGGWDFFVSYTVVDRPWAVWVAWALEEVGFRVLVQAWDLVPGTNWVAGMDEGVRRAQRTVAILSEAYTRSVFGAAEWQAAWAADPKGEKRKLLVFRVADCDRPGLLGQVVGVDLFGCAEQAARAELVSAARLAVSGGRNKPEVAPPFPPDLRAVPGRATFPGGVPGVWNVPARLGQFVGRSGQLEELAEALRGSSVVALAGMGGVGKTSLAVEYVHRHASDFDAVWWVEAEQSDTVAEQIGAFGEALGLPVGVEPAGVFGELRRRGWRWLLVFDNAEQIGAVAPFRPSDGRGRVVVTSRRAGWRAVGAVVEVPTLSRSESVTLLSGRVPRVDAVTADRIAELLGDLALAVEQAAAFCEQTGTPAGEFAELLEERLEEVVELGEVAERARVTVATLWEVSVTRLAVEMPAAVELLELLGFCGPEVLPLDLFAGRSELLGDGSLAVAVADRLAWTRVVGALVGYGLASRDVDAVSVHRLVQATTRRRTSDDRRPVVLATLLRLLRADLPGDIVRSPQNWPRWRELLLHVRTVVSRVPDPGETSRGPESAAPMEIVDLVWLCDRAATYLQEHGQAGEALPMFQRSLAITEAAYGPHHIASVAALNNLAGALRTLGGTGEALRMFQRSLAITEAACGPNHPVVAAILNSVAGTLQDLGQTGEALPMFQRALAIDEAAYGPNHPVVASRLNNLALALRELGRAGEALPILERGLAITEATHGPHHPETAVVLNNLAGTLQTLGRAGETLPLLERALAIDEAIYGPDHPEIASRLNNFALTLRELGRTGEALPILERGLAITEAVYGPHHPETATGLNNLASTLRELGRAGEALPLLERGLAIAEAAYSPNHPLSAAALNNLAGTLQDLGRTGEALPILERGLAITEAVYGPHHPTVAAALNNLAGASLELGRPEEALPMARRALAIAEAAHGPNHPRVSPCLNNLASALRTLGQAGEALPMLKRALVIAESTYSPDHPEIAIRLNNLAPTLLDLGRAEEALPMARRALAITEAAYGLTHPEIAIDLNNLASALQGLGRAGEALPMFERALAITEAAYGLTHPETATVLNNLAGALVELGRPAKALLLLERALAITEAAYGPSHPTVLQICKNLEDVRKPLGG